MQFTCEKYLLQAAIATASRCVSPKSPIPALEGLLIEAGADVRITGYDLKKGVYTSFPADVAESGSVVLSARLFGDIVRNLPDGIVTLRTKAGMLVGITGSSADYDVMSSDAADYPELPVPDYQSSVTLPRKALASMISETVFAVSDNESRPVYTGALFEVENGCLTVVAVDGYRLAMRRETIGQCDMESGSFIVPGAALADVEKICGDSDEPIAITVGAKHIGFRAGETVLVSRRLEGEFLNYRKSIPSTFGKSVIAARAELLRAVDRVSLIVDAKTKNPMRCLFKDGRIDTVCVTPLGRAEDSCPCEGDGGGLEIGFNNRYVQDALKAAPAEKVSLNMSSGSSPCVIKPSDDGESFLYMILPVRLKAGE